MVNVTGRGLTDNSGARAKLDLRRHFLTAYHTDPPRVLDCCQGAALIWTQLRDEFKCESYWGVDLKPKRGRVKIDSVRLLAAKLPQNVIDIDTYGSPWKHWQSLLPNIHQPTTVFLTVGQIMLAGSHDAVMAMGLTLNLARLLPPTVVAKLTKHALPAIIGKSCETHGLEVVECKEAVTPKADAPTSVRYIGIHLRPS